MSKRTVFTNLTPLPAGISRECVMETLRSHTEMIDLNPLVEERHPIKPPSNATAEEYHCVWYSLTDKVQYLPGGLASGKVTYSCCFHDLQNGLQTHCYAPMGLNIKGKWTLGGSLPGEPVPPVELGLGAPSTGLWLREDVDMKCNFMMTSFVKKTLQKAHSKLVDRLLVKAQIQDASFKNQELYSSRATTEYSPSEYGDNGDDSISNSLSYDAYSNQGPTTATTNNRVGNFRPLELSHINENNRQELYPNALSPPLTGSSSGSNTSNRTSYQEPQQAYNQRVSWQNLNQAPQRASPNPRSPSMQSMHTIDIAYRPEQDRTPSFQPTPQQQMSYAAELHSEERARASRESQQSMNPPPSSASGTNRRVPTILGPGSRETAAHRGFPVELE